MNLRQKIGLDIGGAALDEALQWAAAHDFHYFHRFSSHIEARKAAPSA